MQRVVARQMQNWHTFSLHEKARRRDDAACRSRTSIASYGKLQTQIFFTQRPSQAPADSRVPTSGAVLQVPQRHLSNWKRTTKIPNCRALGVRCLGVSVLVCVLVCACERVCLCCSCYRHSAASQWLTNACLPSRLPDKHQCRPPGWTPSANSPHSPPLVLGGPAGLACTTGLAARTGLPFLIAPDEVVL